MSSVQGEREFDYDVIVIGSGPAGQAAAVEAARQGLAVAVVERQRSVGGVCLHTGTVPSKSLREAVLGLTHYQTSCLYHGHRACEHGDISMDELRLHIEHVIEKELSAITTQLQRHGVVLLHGAAHLAGPHEVALDDCDVESRLTAGTIVVAVGTRASRPRSIPFDDRAIIDTDQLFMIPALPRRLAIVGGGVIAIEYASIFGLLGIEVHLIARTPALLPFVERDVIEALEEHLAAQGVAIHKNAAASAYEPGPGGAVTVRLGAAAIEVDLVLAATGRDGLAPTLNLAAVGLAATDRGLLRVDDRFRTAVPHVLAVGDIIGFPSLASTARVQGRSAMRYLLGLPVETGVDHCLPFGIYTIPELAFVGRTARELDAAGVPYVAGVARTCEVARGAISGIEDGLFKLLFHREDRTLLGAHLFGANATELIHLAQTVMSLGGTLDYLTGQVLNYPTLTECFRVAAFDAERKLKAGA